MEAPVAVITLAARGIASPDSAENVQLPTLQQDAGKGNSARGHSVCRLMCAGLVREMEALVAVRTLAQAVYVLEDSAVFVQAARIVGVGMHAKTTFLLGLSKSAAPQAEGGHTRDATLEMLLC